MQPVSGNQRHDLLTSLMNMSLVAKYIFPDPLQMSHACHRFWKCYQTLTFCSLLTRCTIPCACHAKRHLNVQKWSEPVSFFTLLTSKCASRHNGVHFSTSQLPKVVREWCGFYIFTSKCASHHKGVQFFISHVARWLRTRRFSQPTFRPSGATNQWKTEWTATLLPFRAPASSFFWLFLFSDLLSSSLLFSSLTLPTSAFSSVHIVGSLTSKLPLMKRYEQVWTDPFTLFTTWGGSFLVCSAVYQCEARKMGAKMGINGKLDDVSRVFSIIAYPICSMYGIFTYIWAIFWANVGKYSIRGAYGYWTGTPFTYMMFHCNLWFPEDNIM